MSSYPGVEAEQTDASRVDDVPNRLCAGAIQVLLIFPKLDELPARQVTFKGSPTHKVVLVPIPLMYPWASGCVWTTKKYNLFHLLLTILKMISTKMHSTILCIHSWRKLMCVKWFEFFTKSQIHIQFLIMNCWWILDTAVSPCFGKVCTYVEQQWQTFLVRWTEASDAAHRDHCL